MTKKVATIKPIESAITAYKMPDVTIKAIKEFQKAEKLECRDKESRKIFGKHRVDVKSLIKKVDRKRIDNNTAYQEKNNGHAKLIELSLGKSRDVFDTKIKAYDSIAAEKKAEKDRIKSEEAAKIQNLMDDIVSKCAAGLELSKDSKSITEALEALQSVEISAIDFGDLTEDAEKLLSDGIVNTSKALAKRIIYEDEQARQEKEKKQLREEQAAFKKKQLAEREKQIKADKERERKQQIQGHIDRLKKEVEISINLESGRLKEQILFLEDYPVKVEWFQERTKEAEKIVSNTIKYLKHYLKAALKVEKEAEQARLDREALEKEKEDIAAKKKAEDDEKRLDAEKLVDHENALLENIEFDKARKEKLKTDKKRSKIVEADKERMHTIRLYFQGIMAHYPDMKFKTDTAKVETQNLIEILDFNIERYENQIDMLI